LQGDLRTASNFGYNVNQDDVSYQRLREAIASGELMPSERLVESGLADTLGVGRAAIRTAIARLAQERLVERIPNRGARVRRVSDEEALEVLEVRMAIECLAVRRAAANATPDDIRRLKRILADMKAFSIVGNTAGFGTTNHDFHCELLRMARHETAGRMLESLLTNRFQLQRLTTPPAPLDRLAEHGRILAAVEAKDSDAAEREMRAHLFGVIERWRDRASVTPSRKLHKFTR
jgi:DNA-binding GntR family transcriptional regulator